MMDLRHARDASMARMRVRQYACLRSSSRFWVVAAACVVALVPLASVRSSRSTETSSWTSSTPKDVVRLYTQDVRL